MRELFDRNGTTPNSMNLPAGNCTLFFPFLNAVRISIWIAAEKVIVNSVQ